MTIVTPTIEGREELLVEAAMSVKAQTRSAFHMIGLDTERVGPARMRNLLLSQVETPLVAFLDDDDLLDAEHVERLADTLESTGAELAWSYHRTAGRRTARTPRPRDDDEMRRFLAGGRNCIPVTVVARLAAIRAAGGFRVEDRFEDYELWRRMLELGHRFALLREETWTYRFLGGNRTWSV